MLFLRKKIYFFNMSERRELTPPEQTSALYNQEKFTDPDTQRLLAQLEAGEDSTAFDKQSVDLLRQVITDKNKASLILHFTKLGLFMADKFGHILGGVASAYGAAEVGRAYVTHQVRTELLSRFLIDKAKLLLDANPAKISEDEILAGVRQALADFFSSTKDVVNAGTGKIVDAVNTSVVRPTVETTASFLGEVASYPAGAMGWFGGSALTGGLIQTGLAYKRRASFSRLEEFIKKSETVIASGSLGDQAVDPRVVLIELEKQIALNPNQQGYKLNNEEWIQFCSAVRRAKVSLLKEKTKIPEITVSSPELTALLERQRKLVECIVEANRGISQADQTEIAKILEKLATANLSEQQKAGVMLDQQNRTLAKLGYYSKAFVSGAWSSTGIPLAWKLGKGIGKATRYVAKKFVPVIP
jgi:hypothetical protein